MIHAYIFFFFSENESINVKGLEMVNGKRYRICIHTNETTKHYEKWSETLPEVSECSDGVIVDTLSPTTGTVWVGSTKAVTYQV